MMGPRAPLSVRINDGTTDRHVTKYVRGLSFRKTAPGGFASASMQLMLPRATFTDLGPNDKIYVYGPTGNTLFEGFTDNPGTEDGPEGQGFDLTAMGTIVLANDESRALVYIDQALDKWARSTGPASANISVSGDPSVSSDSAAAGIVCQFTPGQSITTNSVAKMAYSAFAEAGMEFGWLVVTSKSGKTDTGYRNEMRYNSEPFGAGGAVAIQSTSQIQTTPVTNNRVAGDPGANQPPTGQAHIALQLRRSGGATNIADDDTWTYFYDIKVSGRRMDRFGTLYSAISGLVTGDYTLASWVVEDLLGRVMTWADKNASQVDTTTWQIDQLAYHDGVKAQQLLEDLSLWEPDYVWEVLHSTTAGYVFKYRAWPTIARYEISTQDGYEQPGADVDLCNRIAVYWTDLRGQKQTTIRGASVPSLGSGSPVLADGSRDPAYTGRVRDAEPITLPDGQGSLANAQRIGDAVLAAKANPPKAATAVVKRPIVDRLMGTLVYPWEIEPGYLVRVRETGDVLRLTELEYVDDDCASKLTLGEPMLTTDQRIARLSKKVA